MTKKPIYKSEKGKQELLSFYNKLLDSWPKPFNEYFVKTCFGETYVIENANKNAPVIVLLHGSSSNSAMWLADVEKLSKDFHVYTVDIIGECGKSEENRPEFIGTNYSDWLNDIFLEFDIKKAAIAGCSLGAWIAIDFTINHPNRVDKLGLLATAGITQVKTASIFWIILTSFLGNWGFNKLNKMVYGNLQIDKTALEFVSIIKRHYKPRTDIPPIFSDEQLRAITIPLLFIGGKNDCFYNSEKTANRLQKEVLLATTFVLENTGHVLVNQTERIINFINT